MPYYVAEQFSKEFTGVNLKNLERTVEDDYISNLRNNCWKEKQQSMFARKTVYCNNFYCLFIYYTMNIDHCFRHYQFWENKNYSDFIIYSSHLSFMNCFCCFLQRKACSTGLGILETLTCTKEHRGLAHQAAPSCPRSQLRYMVEAAFIIKASSPN